MMCRILLVLALAFRMVVGISFSPNVIGDSIKTVSAPWMASIQIEKGDRVYCGATVIKSALNKNVMFKKEGNDPNITRHYTASCSAWVVTAASCLQGIDVDKIVVTLGNLNTEAEDVGEIVGELVQNYSHENYNESTKENDIGLIQVDFDRTLSVLCDTRTVVDDCKCEEATNLCDIPVLSHINEHELNETHYQHINASIYGWGLKLEDGPLQKELHNATIPLKTDQECFSSYGHDVFKPFGMICAGGNGRGPCSGPIFINAQQYDTGGPLTCEFTNESGENGPPTHTYLCGIASFGKGCGVQAPAVFTDVAKFEEWIDKILESFTPPSNATCEENENKA